MAQWFRNVVSRAKRSARHILSLAVRYSLKSASSAKALTRWTKNKALRLAIDTYISIARKGDYKKRANFFSIVPAFLMIALGTICLFLMPGDFAGSPRLCWVVACSATAGAFASVLAFLFNEIGPRRALVALIGQALGLVVVFAGIYRGFGLNEVSPLLDWDTAVYFSTVTWTTLGYGDLSPRRELQLMAAMQAGLGYVFLGLIVGMAANFLTNHIQLSRPNVPTLSEKHNNDTDERRKSADGQEDTP